MSITSTVSLPSSGAVQKKSATDALWQFREANERTVLTLAQKFDLPEIIARALANRGVGVDEAEDFLRPTLKNTLPDPMHLRDMDKAAKRLAMAVITRQKIAVFGDYDVDGATSSAVLKRFFNAVGSDMLVYIPDRLAEGYGPNIAAMLQLRKQGVDVCVTVDCGTLAFEPLAEAAKAGLEVIVLDHHLSAEHLPEAVAVVNPNRLDETSDQKHLAAVGLAFLLAVAVNSQLKEQGWYDKTGRAQPDLLALLDMVALGTVCDVVPLKGVNRAYVSQGLKVLRSRKNIGLAALADVAGIDDAPATYHLGFVLGPRINAGGRVGQADLGARLLSTSDIDEAFAIAQKLDQFNAERRAIEQMVLDEAMAQAEKSGAGSDVIFAVGEGWHPGVIGIVASRLKEKYNRPAAVIALENGVGKASARSIAGVDFGAAIVAASQSGLLIAGGGHAMAAGFTIEEAKIAALQEFLEQRFADGVQEHGQRVVKLDGYLSVAAVTVELAQQLQQLEPYGTANAEPRFVFADVYIIKVDVVGKDHISCIIADGKSGGQGGSIKAMAFRSLETPLGQALLAGKGKNLSIAGRIRINTWQGLSRAELLIDDVAV